MYSADEQAYSEVVSELRQCSRQIEDECGVMMSAVQDCMDNMQEDPATLKASRKTAAIVKAIQMNLEMIDEVCQALQKQMEDIQRVNQQYSDF